MQRFRQMKSLQKVASVHATFHNLFNSERHLVDRQRFKTRRSASWPSGKTSWPEPCVGLGALCQAQSGLHPTDSSVFH